MEYISVIASLIKAVLESSRDEITLNNLLDILEVSDEDKIKIALEVVKQQ